MKTINMDYSNFLASGDETEVAAMLDKAFPLQNDRTAMEIARQVAGGLPDVYLTIFKTAYGLEQNKECHQWLALLSCHLHEMGEDDQGLLVRIAIDRVERCISLFVGENQDEDEQLEEDGLPPIISADSFLDEMDKALT